MDGRAVGGEDAREEGVNVIMDERLKVDSTVDDGSALCVVGG